MSSDQRSRVMEALWSRLRAARRRIDESRLPELPGFTFAFPGLSVARAVGDVAAVARVLHPA